MTAPIPYIRREGGSYLQESCVQRFDPYFLTALNTPENVQALLGITPSNLWRADEASGDLIDSVGGINLVNTNSIARTATRWRRLAPEFPDASNKRFIAASDATFNDDGLTSWAFLAFWSFPVASVGAVRRLLAKEDGTGSGHGYRLSFSATNALQMALLDGSGTLTINIGSSVHLGCGFTPVWASVNWTTKQAFLASKMGSASGSLATFGSLAASGFPFRFGCLRSSSDSMATQMPLAMRFSGAAAEQDGVAIVQKLRRGLG